MGNIDVAYDVALQRDGKIVVAGVSNGNFALARYYPDGRLDSSFGAKGKVITDFGSTGDAAKAMAIQSDDRIVLAGVTGADSNTTDFAVARYTPHGQLDATFDGDGKLTTEFGSGSSESAVAVVIYPDSDPVNGGKIAVAGTAGIPGFEEDFAVARYDTFGALDPTFAGDGTVMLDFNQQEETAHGAALQADGKVVVVGSGSSLTTNNAHTFDVALARVTADGERDLTFGTAGWVITDLRGYEQANSVAIQSDNKLVVAGTIESPGVDLDSQFVLLRYLPTGLLDSSFGSEGKVFTDFGSRNAFASDVALQPDGKIVAAGVMWNPSNGTPDFAVARYEGDRPATLSTSLMSADSENPPSVMLRDGPKCQVGSDSLASPLLQGKLVTNLPMEMLSLFHISDDSDDEEADSLLDLLVLDRIACLL